MLDDENDPNFERRLNKATAALQRYICRHLFERCRGQILKS